MESFVFTEIAPLYSIVNNDVLPQNYLDANQPFSFFDFLKYTKANLSPLQFNDLYVSYIKAWNSKKKLKDSQAQDSIKERYVELLKEITLKYSTNEEKRFLSNIDYNDDFDLDIIIPFYSKKIREICNFYSEKREKLKYKIQKNQIKGTASSLEKSIYETITDVVFSDVYETGTYQKLVDETQLVKDLDIEIEELYDLYTNYLDNDPSLNYDTYDVKTELRKQLYSANINKIDANIFINVDQAISNQIFDSVRVFLTEFGRIFTINYDLNKVNLNCKPDDKLYNIVSANKPKATRLVELKNKLIKKYIGSDFYYITTGSTITDVTSAILFKAENPSGNLLNRHFPTTASVEEESDLQSCRKIGLFFTPEKNSILYFSVPEKKFKIDSSKLEPNKLYIFPDPERYGNTSGLTRNFDSEYPLIHICDYTKSVKNKSHSSVEGDINSSPYTQDFYSYFSKKQLADNTELGKSGLKTNFSSLYDNGVLTKWTTDIYGNQFGLFKSRLKKNLINNTTNVSLTSIVCENYEGGPITFSTNELLPEEVLASNPKWVKPNVWASDYYYNLLIEGGIGKIVNGLMERGMYWGGYLVDGLTIDRNKIGTEVFDINLNSLEPEILNMSGLLIKPNKTLDGNPLGNVSEFAPNFNNDYILSSIKYKDFDAGLITDICESEFNFEDQTNFIVQNRLTTNFTLTSNTVVDDELNSYELRNSYGHIEVRDVITGQVSNLSSVLDVQFSKYDEEVYTKVVDFNIYNDFIWIRTENNIIFEKLLYIDGKYTYSGTKINTISGYNSNNTFLTNVSNPFIFENRDYCMVILLSAVNSDSNNYYIVPILYKVSYNTADITKLYPFNTSLSELSAFKNNVSSNNVKLNRINQPVLSYNTRNKKYSIQTIIEDGNQFSYLYQIKFSYDEHDISDVEVVLYNCEGNEKFNTINFFDTPSLNDNKIILNNITSNTSTNIIQNQGTLTFS